MSNDIAVLPAAAGLTGAEPLPVSQASTDVRTTVDAVAARAAGLGFVATGATTSFSPKDRALMAAVDVRDFGAVFDDRDNTTAIQAAINHAAASSTRIVQMPAGFSRLSSTITVPHGVVLAGMGSINTFLKRTADYGNTFEYASGYNGGGAHGFALYHDHGAGWEVPNTPGAYQNPITRGSHFVLPLVGHSNFSDLLVSGLVHQFYCTGGLRNTFIGVECLTDVWDWSDPSFQVGRSAISLLPGPAPPGELRPIPTDWEFYACRIGGVTSPKRPITWPGGHVTTDVIDNIGALYGLDIQCSEGVRWYGGYMGAFGWAAVRLLATPGVILSAFSLRDAFIDANHRAGLLIDRSGGASCAQITWAPHEHNFQGNGYRGVSDAASDIYEGAASGDVSVTGLDLRGQYRAFIGDVVCLEAARNVNVDINARAWNLRGFYNSTPPLDAAISIGPGCRTVSVTGVLGGGLDGAGSTTDRVGVRYTLAGNPSNVSVTTASGPNTAPAGDLAGAIIPSTFTPTVSAAFGSLGGYTAAGQMRVEGKTCFVSLSVAITGAGSASGYLVISLPVSPSTSWRPLAGVDGATAKALSVLVVGAAVVVRDYAGAYIGTAGTNLLISGSFELA